jgi:hypothetical protein
MRVNSARAKIVLSFDPARMQAMVHQTIHLAQHETNDDNNDSDHYCIASRTILLARL